MTSATVRGKLMVGSRGRVPRTTNRSAVSGTGVTPLVFRLPGALCPEAGPHTSVGWRRSLARVDRLDFSSRLVPASPARGDGEPMDTDRNLLFGVLALQVDLIDPARFAEVCSAWAAK